MPSSSAHADIKAQEIAFFYQNLPWAVLMHVTGTAIVGFMLWDVAEQPLAMVWSGLAVAVTAMLAGMYGAFYKRSSKQHVTPWVKVAVVAGTLFGVVWGLAPWLLLPTHLTDHHPHLLLAMVAFMMAAVGMVSLYAVFIAYIVFVVPMLALQLGYLLYIDAHLHASMGGVGGLLALFLLFFAKRHRDQLEQSLRLRVENRSLLARLERENKAVRVENVNMTRMETLLRQKSAVLDAVSQVQNLFIAEHEPAEIFDQTLKTILNLTGSAYGFIGEVLRDENNAHYLKTFAVTDISWNEETRKLYAENAPTGLEFRNHKSLFGTVLTTGEPVIANDPASDPRAGGLPPGHPPLNAFLGVPLYVGEDMVGMVGLANRVGGYDDELLTALDPVISAAARMIEALHSRRDRDAAQRDAASAMERLTTAIESLNDGFVIFDSEDRLALCNSKYKNLFSETADLLVPGTKFEDILRTGIKRGQYDCDPDRAQEWLDTRMFLHRQPESLLEQKLADGTWLRIEERATPDGGRVGFRVDITELKRTQEDLNRAMEQAKTANKAKSEFLSSMSHELRTPMNAVLGFAQLLMLNPQIPLDPRQRDSVEQILKGGNHLLELINEILDLSHIESGRVNLAMEELDPRDVIEDCIAYIAPLATRRSIKVDPDVPSEKHFSIHADPTRFKQVLLNLLSNAVKYNVEGGTVTLSVHGDGAGFVRFCVADTGPGIPEDKHEEIFQPFSRLGKESTDIEGTGIGLTITRKLAELMGGTLDFESVVGHGSKFWIDIPGKRTDAPRTVKVNPDRDELPTLPGGSHQVLYVEDNPDNLVLMEHVISMVGGAELISAHTGELGLEMAEIHQPGVILMDINLPGISGLEALKRLRALPETSAIPVIAISADAMPSDIKRGLDAGFDAYLTKPINLTEVIDHIKRALEGTLGPGQA